MNDDQFDDTLRSLAGDPEPTLDDREVSRQALASAIADAKHRAGTNGRGTGEVYWCRGW
jgi:hypothetical protein